MPKGVGSISEQQIAGVNDLVVLHRDLGDLARDFRDDAHDERAHAKVAVVRRQPVGNQRPAEQQDKDDQDDQCPARRNGSARRAWRSTAACRSG